MWLFFVISNEINRTFFKFNLINTARFFMCFVYIIFLKRTIITKLLSITKAEININRLTRSANIRLKWNILLKGCCDDFSQNKSVHKNTLIEMGFLIDEVANGISVEMYTNMLQLFC